MVLIARFLGAGSFGELTAVVATVALFQGFASFGMSLSASRLVAARRMTDPSSAGRLAAVALVLTAVISAALGIGLLVEAPLIAASVLHTSSLVAPLRASAAIVFFGTVGTVQAAALTGFESFRLVSRSTMTRGVIGAIMSVIGARTAGVTGAAVGLAVGEVAGCLLNQFLLRKEASRLGIVLTLRNSAPERRALVRLGFPVFLAGVAVTIGLWMGQVILLGAAHGLREVGYYGFGYRWHLLVMFVPAAAAPVMLPLLTNVYSQSDGAAFRHLSKFNFTATLAAVVPTAFAIAALSPVVAAIAGSGYEGAGPSLFVLAIAAIPAALNNVFSQSALAAGMIRAWFISDIVLGVGVVLCATLLIPRLGAVGLAWALFAGMTASCLFLAPSLLAAGRRVSDGSAPPPVAGRPCP